MVDSSKPLRSVRIRKVSSCRCCQSWTRPEPGRRGRRREPPGAPARPGAVRVRVVSEELPPVGALSLYEALAATREQGDVYLFESLDGPDQDRHFAAVGCGRLAELRVFADRVELVAPGDLGDALAAALTAAVGAPYGAEGGTRRWGVRDSGTVWRILRAVQGASTSTPRCPRGPSPSVSSPRCRTRRPGPWRTSRPSRPGRTCRAAPSPSSGTRSGTTCGTAGCVISWPRGRGCRRTGARSRCGRSWPG